MVVTGHLHGYERLLPIYNNNIDEKFSENFDKKSKIFLNFVQNYLKGNSFMNDVYSSPRYPVYLICGSAGNTNGQAKSGIIKYNL